MKTVLEDNLKLKKEVLQLQSEKESSRTPKKEKPDEGLRVEELEEEVRRLKEKTVEQKGKLEDGEKRMDEQKRQLARERGEVARLQGEGERGGEEVERERMAGKTLRQVRVKSGTVDSCVAY